MRKAAILYKGEKAGELIQHDDGAFTFRYTDDWLYDQNKPAISLTLPKTQPEYHARFLFPFFFNMLPEGANKEAICRLERIDQDDAFGLLLTTAKDDTIGAITVKKVSLNE
ncbi:MAG: HipA N-terminal domain-containing protein [Cyclobacteriaceae bacterium]